MNSIEQASKSIASRASDILRNYQAVIIGFIVLAGVALFLVAYFAPGTPISITQA